MNKPLCLIVSGPSGSGKSTISRMLWKRLSGNPAYLSLDSIKHFVHGAESTNHFLDLARIQAESLTRNYLVAGHSVIVEKAFGSYGFVRPFIEIADSLNVLSYYFKLRAPLEVLIKRVERRREAPLDKKVEVGEWPFPTGNRETATRIYRFFERNPHPEGIEIDTSSQSPEESVKIILNHLSS